MKIGPLDPKPSATATPATAERKSPGVTGRNAAEPSAQVALSQQATALLNAEGTGAADGTFDTQKVERLAQAIRDGQFRVNPEAIADKLIANAQELLGRAGGGKPSSNP